LDIVSSPVNGWLSSKIGKIAHAAEKPNRERKVKIVEFREAMGQKPPLALQTTQVIRPGHGTVRGHDPGGGNVGPLSNRYAESSPTPPGLRWLRGQSFLGQCPGLIEFLRAHLEVCPHFGNALLDPSLGTVACSLSLVLK